jgi:hypothetical protein
MKVLFFLLLITTWVQAQTSERPAGERPRLVVGIMVDGLQKHHLQQLWTRFTSDGFKKLTSTGVSFHDLRSNTASFGNASDITTLFTGTVPHFHGITGDRVFDVASGNPVSIFLDKRQSGIQSHLQLSGRAMQTTSWVDELMMAGRTRSKTFVIALHPEDAIAMGGHAANGVVWLDDVNLRWGSTDYYPGGMPWQAAQMNAANTVRQAAESKWQALFSPRTYLAALTDPSVRDFSYTPTDRQPGSGSQAILKTTPVANRLVTELASRIIKEEELGKDLHTDALLLQFTVRTPSEKNFSLTTVEKEDMYLRLDMALQEFMRDTESYVGANQVLYVLFGTQLDTHSPEDLQRFNFHAGYFNSFRSMALLNAYLMAMYGQEKWIKAYYGRHIFLNRSLIEEKGHNFKLFQQLVSEFIAEFEGVQSAWPMQELIRLPVHPETEMARLRNSIHQKTSGDVVIMLKPGWLETDEQNRPVGESGALNTRFPVYFSGWKITPQQVRATYSVTDIAPTLTGLLGLPLPNASLGKEILLNLKE